MRVPVWLTSPGVVIKYLTIALGALLTIMYIGELGGIISTVLWAGGLAYLLSPAVNSLERYGVSRVIAILFLYVIIISLIVLLIVYVAPKLSTEFGTLAEKLPGYMQKGRQLFLEYQHRLRHVRVPTSINDTIFNNLERIQNGIIDFVSAAADWVLGLFGKIAAAFVVPILAFYLLRDSRQIQGFVLGLLPRRQRQPMLQLARRVDRVLGAWIRGQMLVSLVVFVLSFVGLMLVGMDFALVLGIFSGITNFIPYFGPILGAIPGVALALLQSPYTALKVAVVYTLVQQLESGVISPQIMGHSIGLPPLVIIIALLAGGQFGGIVGMIFAVPVAAILKVIISFAMDMRADRLKLSSKAE